MTAIARELPILSFCQFLPQFPVNCGRQNCTTIHQPSATNHRALNAADDHWDELQPMHRK